MAGAAVTLAVFFGGVVIGAMLRGRPWRVIGRVEEALDEIASRGDEERDTALDARDERDAAAQIGAAIALHWAVRHVRRVLP